MVNNKEQSLNDVFHSLSDPTRRAMLLRLTQGKCNVSELPNPHKISKAAISKHLSILHRAKLVEKHKDGRVTHCSANLHNLAQVYELLDQLGHFWRAQLDSLEEFLTKPNKMETTYDTRKQRTQTSNKKGDSRKT